MRLLIRVLVALLFLSTSLCAQTPDYRAYFLDRSALTLSKFYPAADSHVDAGHLHHAANAAATEVRMWQLTGDERRVKSAIARLAAMAALMNSGVESSFFVSYPFSWAYQELDAKHLIPPDLQRAVRSGVAKSFRARDNHTLNNQTLQRAAGLGLASQVWRDLPIAGTWSAYANDIFTLLSRIADVPENSTNYNQIDVAFTFLLADVLNHHELLDKSGIHAMYTRFRDQVSPVGFIPPYGDAGTASNPLDPKWPMTNGWAMYVAAFERAARDYHDPTFRWAAALMARTGQAHEPLGSAYTDIGDLFILSLAPSWTDNALRAVQPTSASSILTRADERDAAAQDKLILAPSRSPGAPFVLCDLYARGAHAHENQHGALTYFEYNNAQLITAAGYNNRQPEQAALVMLRAASTDPDSFPAIPGVYAANHWYQALLPTSRLPMADTKRPNLRRLEGLTVRIETLSPQAVHVARFRLPGKQPVLLDAGTPEEWGKDVTASSDAPTGFTRSITWQSPKGVSMHVRKITREFDCREFPVLEFSWKLADNRNQARPIILRITTSDLNGVRGDTDYHAEAIQLEPVQEFAKVQQKGQDQYGELRFSQWMTPDTTLVRQMVLTGSGILVVRDTLTPGPTAEGMLGGPIWPFGPSTTPTAGPNWFYSAGGSMDLLAYFETAPQRTFGVQTTEIWSKKVQRTAFAKQPLKSGEPVTFVSVLLPLDPGADPVSTASHIETSTQGNTSTLHVVTPRDPVQITISANGEWTVKR